MSGDVEMYDYSLRSARAERRRLVARIAGLQKRRLVATSTDIQNTTRRLREVDEMLAALARLEAATSAQLFALDQARDSARSTAHHAAGEASADTEAAKRSADKALALLRKANAERLLAEVAVADLELREFLYAHAPIIIRRAALREAAGLSRITSGLTVKVNEKDEIFLSMIEVHRRMVADLWVDV